MSSTSYTTDGAVTMRSRSYSLSSRSCTSPGGNDVLSELDLSIHLPPLLHDLHVQQAEEADAEAKPIVKE